MNEITTYIFHFGRSFRSLHLVSEGNLHVINRQRLSNKMNNSETKHRYLEYVEVHFYHFIAANSLSVFKSISIDIKARVSEKQNIFERGHILINTDGRPCEMS